MVGFLGESHGFRIGNTTSMYLKSVCIILCLRITWHLILTTLFHPQFFSSYFVLFMSSAMLFILKFPEILNSPF